MGINSECTPPPPPRIGKIGPYTVFMTPPATPKSELPPPVQVVDKSCPVWSPPMQYAKPSNSSFGFFWNAVAKLQNAHASLDEQVAYWFGLNQSKYQWALDDYYETKNIKQAEEKAKVVASKLENV